MKIIYEWEVEDLLKRNPAGLFFLSLQLTTYPNKIHFKDGIKNIRIGGVTIRKHNKYQVLISEDFAQLNYVFSRDFLNEGAAGLSFYWQMPLPIVECWTFGKGERERLDRAISLKRTERFEATVFNQFGIILDFKLAQKITDYDYVEGGTQPQPVSMKKITIRK